MDRLQGRWRQLTCIPELTGIICRDSSLVPHVRQEQRLLSVKYLYHHTASPLWTSISCHRCYSIQSEARLVHCDSRRAEPKTRHMAFSYLDRASCFGNISLTSVLHTYITKIVIESQHVYVLMQEFPSRVLTIATQRVMVVLQGLKVSEALNVTNKFSSDFYSSSSFV